MTKRPLNKEEKALWQEVAASIKPLKKPRAQKNAATSPKEAAAPAMQKNTGSGRGAEARTKAKGTEPTVVARAKPQPLGHGTMQDMDKRQAARLRKGRLPIEGRIDLHGKTSVEAHDALKAFVTRAHRAGKRCVLVITGKGSRSGADGKAGILRQVVPRWLNEPAFRPLILAFTHARPEDGGEGALYVLLKRTRDGAQAGSQ